MNQTGVVKRRINQLMEEIEERALKLRDLADELPLPGPAEIEQMLAGRRPWSYEMLLLGLLACINFHLAEATVTYWGEGYSRYKPSTFKGEVSDPHILQGLKNTVARRAQV
jgi:hypothetical protein